MNERSAAGKPVAARILEIQRSLDAFTRLFETYPAVAADPTACDFVFGNPHEMPLPEIGEAIARWAVPRSEHWFEYKTSEPAPQRAVARSLRDRIRIDFDPLDVALTAAAFGS